MKTREKNYIYLNIVFLLLSLYVILFPFFIIPLKAIIPSFGLCPYLRMTGNPCPLCGGTRYFADIFQIFKDPYYLINPFGVIMLCVVFEVIFRLWLLIRKRYTRRCMIFDIVYHFFILILFFIYEIIFFIDI